MRHVITKVGLTHYAVFHVWLGCSAVVVSFFGEPFYLIIHLPHVVERAVRLDRDALKRSQVDSIQFGGKPELTADIHKPAAVFMGNTVFSVVLDRSGGKVEFQCGTIQRSLKALHGKTLVIFIRRTETDLREVNRFLLIGIHFFFAVERDEIPVRRVCVRRKPVEGPGYLVRTGLFDLFSLFFREREIQNFTGLFRQGYKELGRAVRSNDEFFRSRLFCCRINVPQGTGVTAKYQHKNEKHRQKSGRSFHGIRLLS